MSAICVLRSSDRTSGDHSSPSFDLGPLDVDVKRIRLLSARIPNVSYNVTAANNVLLWNDGTNRTAAVPVGYYNASALAVAIKTAMDPVGIAGPFTVDYSSSTGRLTVRGTSLFAFVTSPGPKPPATDPTKAIWSVMGFDNGATGDYAAGYVGNRAVDLSTPSVKYIDVSGCGTGVSSRPDLARHTFVVPMAVDFGGLMHYRGQDYFEQSVRATRSSRLAITLFEADGSVADLQGLGWELTIGLDA